MKRPRGLGAAAAACAVTTTAVLATPLAVAEPAVSDPIATGLAGPLQLDVDASRAVPRIVVAEAFAGNLTRVRTDGTTRVLRHEDGYEVAGVAIQGRRIFYTMTRLDEVDPASFLRLRFADGTVGTVANLRDFEVAKNPDAGSTYGILGLDQECSDQLPEGEGLRPYHGVVDSHPYAVAVDPEGGWYVAEAAGNTILHVSTEGAISLVKTFAPRKVEITEQMAEANELPECTVGHDYATEAVPTDVEVDRDGRLVVSLLPGGPEDLSLGARGEVVRVRPATGRSKVLATGFAAATNVAVAGRRIFVSELLGGQISRIDQDGEVSPFAEAPTPAALEWSKGRLYAGVDVLDEEDGGEIVTVTP